MRRLVIAALSLLALPATSTGAPLDVATGLHEPTLSTFTVELAPGGSAILHRTPSSGYVVVHVLSGAIHAQAWRAGLGDYHAGETWLEPAFAHDITAANASATEPARVFVVVVGP